MISFRTWAYIWGILSGSSFVLSKWIWGIVGFIVAVGCLIIHHHTGGRK
jgi:hypothetical protein